MEKYKNINKILCQRRKKIEVFFRATLVENGLCRASALEKVGEIEIKENEHIFAKP